MTAPTEKQIEAFNKAYDDSLECQPREHNQAVYAGLSAALAVVAGAVGVKPLEWEPESDGTHRANSSIGPYIIWPGTGFSYDLTAPVGGRIGTHKRIDAAKAAAQADYEARIRSALTPASPAVKWVEWRGGDFLPIPPEMRVTVLLRDGSTEGPAPAREFGGDESCWKHRGTAGDIVAYTSDILFAVECPTCNGTGKEGRHSICRDCDEVPASSAVEGEAVADGLIEFAKAMIRLSWEGCDADGGLIQETALKFGLLEQTVFDRTKHKDPQGFTEDGDWWYVFAGPLASPAPQTEG